MRRARGQRSGRRPDERGASAVIVAVCTAVALVAGAFAVDLGMQRVLRGDLQAVVDVVSLDLARELTGGTAGSYTAADRARIDAALAAGLRRNAALVGGAVSPAKVRWELVARDDAGGWRPARTDEMPGGVRVTATSEVGLAFGGVTGVGRGGATRTAVAASRTTACLRVGSYAAQVDTGRSWLLDALLGDLLGSRLALKVLDPDAGLAGVDLRLLDLIEELDPLVSTHVSAASFTEAAGVAVGLGELMLAAVHALERQSGRLAEAGLLRNVYDGVRAELPNVMVRLGDLVDLTTAEDAAAELDLNVLDLVAGSLALANGTNVLALPLTVRVPLPVGPGGRSLVDLTARVKVGQKPVVKCSGRVESSQIEVDLAGEALALDLGLIKARVPLSVRVTLADASAVAQAVRCLPSGKRVEMLIDSGLLGVEVRLGQRAGEPASPRLMLSLLDVGLPGWNGIEVVSGTIVLSSGQSLSRPTRADHLDIVGEDYGVSLPASLRGLGIPTLHPQLQDLKLLGGLGPLSSLLEFLGIGSLLQWVTNLALEGLVNPLVGTLDRWLLDPLLRTLGIDVAGGRIEVAPTVDCGTPRLVG